MHHLRSAVRRVPSRCVGTVLLLCVAWMGPGAGGAWAEDEPPAPKPPAVPAAVPEPTPQAPPRPPMSFHNEGLIELENGDVIYFYRTNFVTPDDLKGNLTKMGFAQLLGKTGKMESIPAQNQLLIQGDPDAVEILLDAVGYFDVSSPQVFIEAKVIEITHESNFEFGMGEVWDRDAAGPDTIFRGTESTLNPPSFLRSTFPPGFPFQGSSLFLGLVGSNAEKYGALDATIQALLTNGKAELLSKPSIIATQNVKATVTTEEDIPIAILQNASRTNETFQGTTIKSGVSLTVLPLHIGESFVTLQLTPEVRGLQLLGASRVGGTFAPIRTHRKADTTVTLGDKETLVIGGLYTNSSVTEKAKTPILSELPVLGEIFTRTRETKLKTELVFILTPHIVRKTADLKIVVPPSELERLERAEAQPKKDPTCEDPWWPFPFRKPGAYFEDE